MRRFLAGRPITGAVTYTVVGVIPLFLTSAQAPRLQAELGFGKTQLGYVVATFFLVSSIASRLAGAPVDRIGAGRAMRIGAALSLASLALIVVAAGSWPGLALFLGIAGLANAFTQLGSNRVVADRVHGSRQGLGFGIKQAAIPTGAVLAGLVVPATIGGSWRLPFAIGAVLALAMVLAAPRYEPGADVAAAGSGPSTPPGTGGSRRLAPLWLLALAAALAGGIGNSLAAFVADASVDKGFGDASASILLTVGSAVSIGVRVGAGALAGRDQRSGVSELLTLLLLAVAGFLVLAASGDSNVVFVLGVLIAFAGAWGWPGVMYYTVTRTSDLAVGSATGRVLSGAYLGTVVLPPLAGWTAETLGFTAAFAGAAFLAVLSFAAVVASQALLARQRQRVPL